MKEQPSPKVVKLRQAKSSPPPPPETWPVVIKLLHGPTRNRKNEEIHQLEFRQPKGGDIRRVGNPVRLNSDYEIIVDERKMTRMMAALSGLRYVPLIDLLDARDWSSCSFWLQRFFLPNAASWIEP